MSDTFDLIVLGGGPAGASAAGAAGFLGKRAALVEMTGVLGGAGTNTGTIPSKTLRETALVLSGWRSRRLFGVDLSLRREATIGDFMLHTRHVSAAERARTEARLDLRHVTRYTGHASFINPHLIRVIAPDGRETRLHGEKILIATGSSPLRPPEFCFDDPRVHDSDEILHLTAMPRKMVVIGGGVIGSEYAGTFAAMGIETHLVDGRDTLMPFLDAEISRALAEAMTANGVRFHWKERVLASDISHPGFLSLTLTGGSILTCDALLVCAGRQSNTARLNLEAAGITPGKRGLVPVNQFYQSEIPHIYAAGDVVGPPALAATGIEQARVAVAHAFGSTFKSDLASLLPTGIYTIPEASMVGDTEASLTEKGIAFVTGHCRYADLPRGEIIGDQTGFLKLIFRRGDMRLMGVHLLGEHATELVHVGLIAMLAEAGADLFNRACFNYPTLGDLYKYAAFDALQTEPMIKLLLLLLSLLPALSGCSHYATISETRPVFKPVSHTVGTLDLARKNIIAALAHDSKNPHAALADLLSATEIAASELKRHPDNMEAREAYNFALARVFTQLRDSKISAWDRPLTVSGNDGAWELSGTTTITKEAVLGKIEFIPADQIQVGGTYTSERLVKEGLGAPLVAVLADASEFLKRDKFVQGRKMYYGVTAVARFEGRRCIVSFEDPLSNETTVLGNRPYPLAADYTAPLAIMLVRENPKKMELTRLLRPGKYTETARLARLQPYDPKKIPVICIHGLMDSPATWTPLINTLRADPAIRANYQFWFFSYPSGYPYQHSAAILRRQMDAIKRQHPEHKDAVLIGHSMGGCITRLMITDTGDRIWRETFKQSPAETKLSPETRQLLTDALIFKKREDVARAILIAAPLRGSDLASGWLGRFGARLVHSPVTLVKAGGEALQSVRTSGDYVGPTRIPNSVDTMSPKNRFVQFINKIEPSRSIPYHVIVGDRGKGGNPDHAKPVRGDGFVPYWSSHMDGAASELIVPSNHSAHQNPQAIAEVMRILKLHARTFSKH